MKNYDSTKAAKKHELRQLQHGLFKKSRLGIISGVVCLIIAISSICIYWKVFELDVLVSIFLGIMTWFVITYILDKTIFFPKFLKIEKQHWDFFEKDIEDSS